MFSLCELTKPNGMTSFRFLSFLFLITLYSCGQNPNFSEVPSDTIMEQTLEKVEDEIPEEKIAVDRKVIKEGDISFGTSNAKETRALISKSISEFKGYISSDNVIDYTDKIEHRLTMRIPAERLVSCWKIFLNTLRNWIAKTYVL